MKKTLFILLGTVMLGLAGCGSGGGDGGSQTSQTPPPESNENTGFVGDGYIEGAYVCHDSNNNWDCLDETDYTMTVADGSFTLSNYNPGIDLLVQVPVGAVDNGPFANGSTVPRPFTTPVWYIYPAGAAPQNGPIFVGPLSTLVAAHLQEIPGITVNEAVEMVSTQLGTDPDDLLGDYIANGTGTSSGNSLQFTAEIANASVAGSTTSTGLDFGALVADTVNVASTASSNDPTTFDPGTYTPSPAGTTSTNAVVALTYQGVSDIHTDLTSCYFGFESWDGNADRQHKKLCLTTDPDTGDEILNITEHTLGVASNWVLLHDHSSAFAPYQSKPVSTLIDMSKVNHPTEDYTHPYRLFPSALVSSSGSWALFDSYGFEYKLIVSEADIDSLSGSVLPKGTTVGSLIDPVTFGTGDKLYKAVIISQNQTYTVDNGYDHLFNTNTVDTVAGRYIVYDDGTVGGADFSPMSNTQDMMTLVGSTATRFVIEYKNSSNFTRIRIDHAYNPTAIFNVCKFEHIVNGSNGGMAYVGTYRVETHNGTPFFVLENYRNGEDLFIGKVEAVDGASFVYGLIHPANISYDVTEGVYQDGDIMDDIMLNQSARDRVLSIAGITTVP